MRTLMKVQFPIEAGNRGIKDGTLPDIIRKTLETVQAEAAYFTAMDGQRTMLAVFESRSDIPRIAEPLFHGSQRIRRVHAVHECGGYQDRPVRRRVASAGTTPTSGRGRALRKKARQRRLNRLIYRV